MRTHRTLSTLALLVIATISLAACVAVDEVVTKRDLTCEATPDNLCVRIANALKSDVSARNIELTGRPMSVEAFPVDCGDIGRGEGARGPAAERCWRVRGTDPDDGSDIIGVWVYEGPNGTLSVDRGRWLRPGQRPGE